MKEPDGHIVDLLLWRQSGELSENERAILDDWINTSAELRCLVEDLENVEWFNQAWRRYNGIP